MGMDAKAFLERVWKYEIEISNKQAEIERLNDQSYSLSALSDGERVQTSGNPHKTTNAVDRKIDIEREIRKAEKERAAAREEIIAVISQLSPMMYSVLYMRYLRFMQTEEISEEMGKCTSWGSATLWRARQKVQEILDRREL